MGSRVLCVLTIGVAMASILSCGEPEPSSTSDPVDAEPTFDVAGMEVLGSGYDLTGNYADVRDIKAAVLDLERLAANGNLRQVRVERATYRVVSGRDSHEYQRSLAIEANVEGEYKSKTRGTFSGSLKGSFDKKRYTSRDYSFATVQSLIRKRGLRVAREVAPERLSDYLTPAAKKALRRSAPEDLIDTFGTHVLIGVIVGGRLDFKTSANMSFEKQDRTIDVYARASFKNVFASASIEARTTDEVSWNDYSASEQKDLEVFGGRSEYGQHIVNDQDYKKWIDSVDENAVFVDFARDGLLGIWELIDDEERRTEVKAAWNAYAAAHGITLAAAGIVRSSFEGDHEGWEVLDGETLTHVQRPRDGYFGGYIWSKDKTAEDAMVFVAPAEFLGDKSEYLGGSLEYALWDREACYQGKSRSKGTGCTPMPSGYLVQILSRNGNLFCHSEDLALCNPPAEPPTTYRVQLTAGGELVVARKPNRECRCRWVRHDGEDATDCDLLRSLTSLQGLYVYGEFETGWDFTALDEVSLAAPDPPLELDCSRDRSGEGALASENAG